jgi:hypothetical protein
MPVVLRHVGQVYYNCGSSHPLSNVPSFPLHLVVRYGETRVNVPEKDEGWPSHR